MVDFNSLGREPWSPLGTKLRYIEWIQGELELLLEKNPKAYALDDTDISFIRKIIKGATAWLDVAQRKYAVNLDEEINSLFLSGVPSPKFNFGDHVIVHEKEGFIYGMSYTVTGTFYEKKKPTHSDMGWLYSVVFNRQKPWERIVGVQEEFLRRYEYE